MDWTRVRLLGNRIVGRVRPLEVSEYIEFPDSIPSSTIDILQSSNEDFPIGTRVIVDKGDIHPIWADEVLSKIEVMFYGSAVLAIIKGSEVIPVNGYYKMVAEAYDSPIIYDGELRDLLRWFDEDGKVWYCFRDSGFIVTTKDKEYRLIHEDDFLLEECNETC